MSKHAGMAFALLLASLLSLAQAQTINGRLFDNKGEPIPGVTIKVKNGSQSTISDAQGHFTMNTIPPGRYTLFAWENVLSGAWQNAEFIAANFQDGVPVSVSAGERTNIEMGFIKDRR